MAHLSGSNGPELDTVPLCFHDFCLIGHALTIKWAGILEILQNGIVGSMISS